MYIRTKDGVYDLENDDIVKIDGKYKKCYVQKDTGDTCFKDIEVINVSENLEELCDEFVIEYIASEVLVQVRYAEFQWAEEEFESDKKETLYGAIRVAGKGLIYVAKMNDKGEFELI